MEGNRRDGTAMEWFRDLTDDGYGVVDNVKEPAKVEKELWKIIPPEEGNGFCHRLVDHGRAVCTARTKPYCDKCCLADVCRARKEFANE